MNSEHEIVWREAYGGSLYKWQNTLEAIEIGLTDIGWVGALWETSKMPLQNVTYYTPFVTDDLALLLDLFDLFSEFQTLCVKGRYAFFIFEQAVSELRSRYLCTGKSGL